MSPIAHVERRGRGASQDESGGTEGPKPRIPSSQWEAKRGIITQLYQEEKRSLKEVMDIMEKEHGFTATVKMFKSRIFKWRIDKKLKSDEVLAIMVRRREREALGKETEFTIRGQPVDMDNINRYIKRNPQLVERFYAGETPSTSAALGVECHTPNPLPALSAAASPMSPSSDDTILGLLTTYIDEMFQTGSWRWEYNVSCDTLALWDCSEDLFERLLACLGVASKCMARYDPVQLRSILQPGFAILKTLVRTQSPVFGIRMVCLLGYLSRHHENDLFRIIARHLASLTPIVLGEQHPMTQIWRKVAAEPWHDYDQIRGAAYDQLVPMLEARIGPANLLTTMVYGDHVDFLLQAGRAQEALLRCREYVHRGEATGQQHAWMQELSTAELIMANSQGRTSAADSAGSATDCSGLRATRSIQLGNMSLQEGATTQAIAHYSQAIHEMGSTESDDRLMLTALANLELAHLRAGHAQEAERLRIERLRRQDNFSLDTRALASRDGEEARPRSMMNLAVTTQGSEMERENSAGLWDASPASMGSAAVEALSPMFMSPGSATFSMTGPEREW